MQDSIGEAVDAGWYIDPHEEGSGRYHDGTKWTDSTVSIPPGKTLPRVPGTRPPQPAVPQPTAVPSSVPRPAPQVRPASNPSAVATDRAPAAAVPPLKKQPKPTQNRQRLMVLLGVLVVVIGAAVLVFVMKHHNDQNTQVEGANQSRTSLPLSNAPCRLAMTQQLGAGATPPGGIPGALLSCTPQQWVSVYRGAAQELGQTNIDGPAALRAACLPYQSGQTKPQACANVTPPTSGP